MAKQRDAIRMSDDDLASLFAECRSLQVATIGKDGAPHLTTLWYCLHDGKVMFETYGKSQKVINLRRDPRLSVLVEAGETYGELRGVSIRGRAELVEDNPRLHELMKVLIGHHFPGQSAAALDAQTAEMAKKRIVVIVHPEKQFSWDHRKLGKSG